MRKLNQMFLATTVLALASCSTKEEQVNYQVIPLPQEVVVNQEAPFTLQETTRILYPEGNELLKRNAEFLSGYIKEATGKGLSVEVITSEGTPENAIILGLDKTIAQKEGYELKVTPKQITISGQTPNGVFYGIQTLRKSIPATTTAAKITLPAADIKDYPRFAYRGMHLDVGRHFFPVEFVKKYIDLLALHNINTFHWHLTEDQGWRIEIKKYPKLTEIGSQRSETVIGHNSGKYDGTPHGGFYTQEQIKEVVAYAQERYITIIPEVDLPGHMLAALASYPELGCTGGPYEVEKTWGVFPDVICIGNEKAMVFLEDVLSEVIELFPSEYIHIGGDEAPRDRWKKCPKCQARIKSEKLKSDKKHTAEDRLQSYCMSRIEKFLNSKGRRIIGWDEILEGDVAPNATVMSWRGMEGGLEAAQLGHDVIMTPNTYVYFDYYQTADTKDEPDAIGGCLPLERVYSLEPVPATLNEEEKKHIIGAQANLWTEYIPTTEQVEYMVLPRMAALAEVQWTLPEKKDYRDFTHRLPRLLAFYDRDGLNYGKHVFNITSNITSDSEKKAIMIELSTIDDAPIYYTLDGTEPAANNGTKYEGPIAITQTSDFKAVAIRPNGNSKVISEQIDFNKATCRPIELKNEPAPKYSYNGAVALVDGLKGTNSYASGRWLGFPGKDVEAIIDLGQPTEISKVSTEAVVDISAWIMGASGLTVAISEDGKDFREVASKDYPAETAPLVKNIESYSVEFSPVKATFVKVVIKHSPALPKGHAGEGKAPFLFVDEISVN
ncbi:glycoside hydrolase family 20 protein [Bacteroides sp.]